jgi:hypothetical protein
MYIGKLMHPMLNDTILTGWGVLCCVACPRLVLPETRQLDDCILLDQPPGTKIASSIRTADTREASGDGGSKSRAAATASGTDTQQSTHGTPATASSSSGTGTSSPSSNSSSIVLSDLQEVAVIGSGSSGVVKKVLHRPTQQVSPWKDAHHAGLTYRLLIRC